MVTLAPTTIRSHATDMFERLLSLCAIVLLAAVVIAIAKGRADWAAVPVTISSHLATIVVALVLTPVMLLRRRGDRLHRQLGWIGVTAMLATALISFAIRTSNDGGFSVIHILSVWTCIQVPLIVWSARHHRVRAHRSAVRGMVTGALLIAGFFTFPFDRLMGHWLFA